MCTVAHPQGQSIPVRTLVSTKYHLVVALLSVVVIHNGLLTRDAPAVTHPLLTSISAVTCLLNTFEYLQALSLCLVSL